jgi:AraC-like DNA-binding protein
MAHGRALYRFDRSEVAVDDGGYLILNEGQPYSIEIASPTLVETFVLWFPNGWCDEVFQTVTKPAETVLDTEPNEIRSSASFFERYTLHDDAVSPKARLLRAAYKGERLMQDSWLEEKLRDLLASMIASQDPVRAKMEKLRAVRVSTREELWRRVNRARDYLHAHLKSPVSLAETARVACLSPFHLLRVFRCVFGETPHQYLNRCRIERAKFLLEKTQIPVTAICLEAGFSSLGSFSSLFRRTCGVSPRQWRQLHGGRSHENSKIREVFLTGAT